MKYTVITTFALWALFIFIVTFYPTHECRDGVLWSNHNDYQMDTGKTCAETDEWVTN